MCPRSWYSVYTKCDRDIRNGCPCHYSYSYPERIGVLQTDSAFRQKKGKKELVETNLRSNSSFVIVQKARMPWMMGRIAHAPQVMQTSSIVRIPAPTLLM